MITIYRLEFTEALLARITETIKVEPQISRRQLSRRICQWMDWRSPNGKFREMSCRKALVELHRRKLIELPECGGHFAFRTRRGARPSELPSLFPLDCSLAELGPMELIPIRSASSKNSRIWNALLDSYHYLRSGPLCGAQLRYLIWSERFGPLGGLSFSASAWRVRCRDEFIGWSEDARRYTQQLVVNNSRLLIAPMVKVPDLASHVLSQCAKRLAEDWQERYSYRPVLVETFIERGRFTGTCYRAANWQYVGKTTGRGRQGTGATTKDVYLYPLCEDWKQRLCSLPDGTISTIAQTPQCEPADWTEEEFGAAPLGDRRLVERLMQLGDSFFAKPTANIPQACATKAATKAAYRFFDNDRIGMDAILAPHYEATVQRMRNHEIVLVVQDTSSLNYTSHPMTEGLGPINTMKDKSIGLLLHDTMAFTPEGTPLGLLDVQCWARDPAEAGKRHQRYSKAIEEKESIKWLNSYRAVCEVQARCPKTQLIVMADREADIHELFVEYVKIHKSAQLLIRAEKSRNRNVYHQDEPIQHLWSCIKATVPAGLVELLVPPRQDRPSRLARLEVRFAPVTLKAPRRKSGLPDVPVYAVLAKEIDPPAGVDEPLEWMLISTLPVISFEEAKTVLARYARRWGIEVYHRVLKSGCRIEDRQLGSARRLENCLAIDMVVAWRIHHLTWLGRETPEMPCTIFFEDEEWKALVGFINQTPVVPVTPPTLRQALVMVATLGGFLNRKSDKDPGTETIWRGLQRLDDITRAYIAFVLRPQQPPSPVSSNPTYG
jgi:hypothetical protein